jgi:hypothetical protein
MVTYAMGAFVTFPANEGRETCKCGRVSEVTINSSFKSLTDTAEIVIPRRIRLPGYDRFEVSKFFRPGDPVSIKLGYDGSLFDEFTGYIVKVDQGIPLVISCENEAYKLKRNLISVSLRSCTLKELLSAIVPGYDIVCDETKIMGTIRYSNMTPMQCLDELKKQGINCFFVGKTLHAMDIYSRLKGNTHKIILEQVADASLKKKDLETVKVIIELARKIGKRMKVEVGEKNATTIISREYSGYTATDSVLLSEAKAIYNKAITPGLNGDVLLFGVPRVELGDILNLRSTLYPKDDVRNGSFYIEALTKTFNPQGYRQKCTLGEKYQ